MSNLNQDSQSALTIKNNEIKSVDTGGGGFVVGTQQNFNFIVPKPNPDKLLKLVEKFKNITEESPEFQDLVEFLDDYKRPRPGRKIIGLENKLIAGARETDIEDATYLKARFARRFARYQLSSQHMAIHKYLLSQINERFRSKIKPYIKEGHPRIFIDAAVSDLIIQPFVDEVIEADPSIDADIIHGMLYFLTGNCHIEWT